MASKVKLICTKTKNVLVHDLDHAQNIFDLQANKGFDDWAIEENEPYELKDGIIIKRATKKDKGTGE